MQPPPAPAPLGLLCSYSYAFLKATLGLFSRSLTPTPGIALQLVPEVFLSPWNSLHTASICKLGRSHPRRTHPAQQAAVPALPQAQPQHPHDPTAARPDLLLNLVGAEAAQHRKVPTLHLQHGEMRSRRVGPDVISTPSSWLVCSLVPEAPAAGSCVGGTALVLSPMAPGQSLAASPKLFFPGSCQALYWSG